MALKELGIESVDFVVAHPTDKTADADYYSNVAMAAANEVGKAPLEIAKECVDVLNGKIDQVKSVEVAGPGFLNFKLERDFYTNGIKKAQTAADGWGKNDSLKGKRIMVEYTQPNPLKTN